MRVVKNDELVLMRWHLLLCKPNQHHIARRSVSRLGCEVFLPLQPHQRIWRGRVMQDLRPVFPGYLFVGIDPARPQLTPLRSAYGVSRIVGFGDLGPASVPVEIVAGLMARCNTDSVLQSLSKDFVVGDQVRIISGPFADFVTTVDDVAPDCRLHVLLDLLGRSSKVVLDPEMAELHT